ncbi:hypothetical protein KQX54_010736 [Cotesia glomerata]|uniref:FP protein C-terminal domain-containing protein n=1 Tax=Cotesia glomerata TaxID=32391 RepID=A0AAV7IP34_COTGL|nr:hypothetical protein KQX54_010736 [Cotesia glomerata]
MDEKLNLILDMSFKNSQNIQIVLENLNKPNQDIKDLSRNIVKNINKIRKLSEDLSAVNRTLVEITKSHAEATEEIKKIANELLISGVPDQVKNELTSSQIINQIFTKLEVGNLTNDVLSIREFKNKKNSNRSETKQSLHSFILSLKSSQVCDYIIDVKRRARKLLAEDIFTISSEISSSGQVFINEFLHSDTYNLLNKVKAKAKELKFKFVWVFEVTIYIKKDDDSSKIPILTEVDLNKLTIKLPSPYC